MKTLNYFIVIEDFPVNLIWPQKSEIYNKKRKHLLLIDWFNLFVDDWSKFMCSDWFLDFWLYEFKHVIDLKYQVISITKEIPALNLISNFAFQYQIILTKNNINISHCTEMSYNKLNSPKTLRLLIFICPPLAVGVKIGTLKSSKVLLTIILTLLLWIPGKSYLRKANIY